MKHYSYECVIVSRESIGYLRVNTSVLFMQLYGTSQVFMKALCQANLQAQMANDVIYQDVQCIWYTLLKIKVFQKVLQAMPQINHFWFHKELSLSYLFIIQRTFFHHNEPFVKQKGSSDVKGSLWNHLDKKVLLWHREAPLFLWVYNAHFHFFLIPYPVMHKNAVVHRDAMGVCVFVCIRERKRKCAWMWFCHIQRRPHRRELSSVSKSLQRTAEVTVISDQQRL